MKQSWSAYSVDYPHETATGPFIPLTDDPITGHPVPDSPAKRGGKKGGANAGENENLEGILGGGKGTPMWEAFWKLVCTFGGTTKNPAPKRSAGLYMAAIKAGATPERIQHVAQVHRNGVSDHKFMPQVAAWLENEGFKTPDLSPSTSTHVGTARNSAEAEWMADLQAEQTPEPS